jgi:hypothetical protein
MEKVKEFMDKMPDANEMMQIENAMKTIMPYVEKLSLLLEFMPTFDVQRIKLGGKSYVAILFERKQEPKPEVKP